MQLLLVLQILSHGVMLVINLLHLLLHLILISMLLASQYLVLPLLSRMVMGLLVPSILRIPILLITYLKLPLLLLLVLMAWFLPPRLAHRLSICVVMVPGRLLLIRIPLTMYSRVLHLVLPVATALYLLLHLVQLVII